MHVIAAKAVCFKEALTPEYKVYQENIVKNAKSPLRRPVEERDQHCVRDHRESSYAGRSQGNGDYREGNGKSS